MVQRREGVRVHPGRSGEDIFVHHTAIRAEGFKSLSEGERVDFEIVKGPKGLQAANVRRV